MIPVGPYRHRNGGLYTVLACAEDSTNAREGTDGSQPLVVLYVSLTTGKLLVRDLEEFVGACEWPDGSRRPRFMPAAFSSRCCVVCEWAETDCSCPGGPTYGPRKDTAPPPTEKSKASSTSSDRIRAVLAVEEDETDDGDGT